MSIAFYVIQKTTALQGGVILFYLLQTIVHALSENLKACFPNSNALVEDAEP